MKTRYFLVDETGTLQKAAHASVEGAWSESRPLDNTTGSRPVGILTVLCDDSFVPIQCFQTRVRVVDGCITQESRNDALYAWDLLRPSLNVPGFTSAPREDPRSHPAVIFQFSGWPPTDELRRQLAVALDVPIERVPDAFYVGGPLVASMQLGISIRQALTYFPAQVAGDP